MMAVKTNSGRKPGSTSTTNNNVKPAPVHKISLSPVHVSIWKNSSNRGEFYSITIERAYKSGEEFHRTNSFGSKHLQALEILIAQARAWIEDHKL